MRCSVLDFQVSPARRQTMPSREGEDHHHSGKRILTSHAYERWSFDLHDINAGKHRESSLHPFSELTIKVPSTRLCVLGCLFPCLARSSRDTCTVHGILVTSNSGSGLPPVVVIPDREPPLPLYSPRTLKELANKCLIVRITMAGTFGDALPWVYWTWTDSRHVPSTVFPWTYFEPHAA